MRAMCLTAAAFLLSTSATLAQQGGVPAQPAPAVDPVRKLDQVLEGWERSMTTLASFNARCKRTTVDKALGATDVFEGQALFMKAAGKQPSRASLFLEKKGNPAVYEKYVCTGTFLYEYAADKKVIRIHDMPTPRPGQVGDDNFLQFLFGMKAVEAKGRYDIQYVPAPATDRWYHYLRIRPKLAQDKADFSEARLVLMADTNLPRQLWYHQPNGNEITWDFPDVRLNDPAITAASFAPPQQLPPGWRMERLQQARVPNNPAPAPKFRPQDR